MKVISSLSQKFRIENIFIRNSLYFLSLIIFSVIWGLGQYPNFFFLRFFGVIPFLYIILYRKHYLIESLLFGWIAYTINFYWLYITFKESGKLPIIFAILIPLLLCLYYALQYPLIALIYKKFNKFDKRLLFSFPLVFVFIDFLFPKLFTHSISDSQIGFHYFIQLVDITGMTGLTLIIMYMNVGLFLLLKKILCLKKIKIVDLIFLLPFLIAILYGFTRVSYFDNIEESLEKTYASMIQGNITGKQKMDQDYFKINIDRYNRLTQQAIHEDSPDFIIWPESVFTRAYDGTQRSLEKLIYDNYPPLILGITFWDKEKRREPHVSNSSFLIKNRTEKQRYVKQHLLAFGEYIPFEKTFPFLKKLTPLSYSMKKGKTSSIFFIKNARASMSICFEDIFPNEIRKKVNEGSNIMINITNDSWYGKGLGPLHHSILARLRSIENRRSLYRCTATGLTTASDLTGKIVAQGEVWEEQVVSARLPLYENRTVYSYIGETFSYLCVLFVIIILLMVLKKYFTKKRSKFNKQRHSIHKLKRILSKNNFNEKQIKLKRTLLKNGNNYIVFVEKIKK